jgi:hypothetical protein
MIVKKKTNAGHFLYIALAIVACDFPYSPQPQPDPRGIKAASRDTGAVGNGYLYPVNVNQQTCNPSISQSAAFPACMLWLGFDRVSIHVPDSMSGFSSTPVKEHDRLTIVDTSNSLRWYMMVSDFSLSGELQCPEWSTHAGYIACLVGAISQPYSGYAVRIGDKKFLKLCDKTLDEFSTPHFWLPDTAVSGGVVSSPVFDANGFTQREDVLRFFGTTQFKFVYVVQQDGGTLYYIDYSVSGDPAPAPLQKPAGKESRYCGSPLISPDGNWVAYHCFSNSSQGGYYSSYIQRLSPDSKPVFIADNASDPHWWADLYNNNDYYIIYSITKGAYFSEYDFSDRSIENSGAAGATVKLRLKGTWKDAPGHVGGLEPDAQLTADTLIRLPFKGGLSRDGYFLCTAYKYGYIVRLE